jgi:IclR family transcriptional regulator, KDG regulon repressor
MKEENRLNSIEKSLNVMNAFKPNNKEMGTRELSRKLGFSSSTVSRILLILMKYNMVRKNITTGKYQLGSGVQQLSNAFGQSYDKISLLDIVEPYLMDLKQKSKENIGLTVYSNNKVIIIRQLEGVKPIQPVTSSIGSEVQWHASSSAKIILAFLSKDIQKIFFKQKREQFTSKTITDLSILKKQLIKAREMGVGFDYGEKHEDVWAVSAALFDQEENPIGAVGIYGPSFRLEKRLEGELADLTRETARKISQCLL